MAVRSVRARSIAAHAASSACIPVRTMRAFFRMPSADRVKDLCSESPVSPRQSTVEAPSSPSAITPRR